MYAYPGGFHKTRIKITADKMTAFRNTFPAKILRVIACEIEKVQKLTTLYNVYFES